MVNSLLRSCTAFLILIALNDVESERLRHENYLQCFAVFCHEYAVFASEEEGTVSLVDIAQPLRVGDVLANVRETNGRMFVRLNCELWIEKAAYDTINNPGFLNILVANLVLFWQCKT